MEKEVKCYDLFWNLYNNNLEFRNIIIDNMAKGKVRFFGEEEWNKINEQNFMSPTPLINTFMELFENGFNIGNCVGTSRQLSYSYNDVDIVSGRLPMIKGTLNAENVGGHCWLERKNEVIDTSLMIIFDKDVQKELGYIEEERLTSIKLRNMDFYQARKEYVNDPQIKRKRTK